VIVVYILSKENKRADEISKTKDYSRLAPKNSLTLNTGLVSNGIY
jgi:hypothetical protein